MTERGRGTQRVSQFLVGDDLQEWIVAQALGVVGVLISGHDPIDPLRQQGLRVVPDTLAVARISGKSGQVEGRMVALIKARRGIRSAPRVTWPQKNRRGWDALNS